jgi:hypothetical protein
MKIRGVGNLKEKQQRIKIIRKAVSVDGLNDDEK